eukprot:m.834697 g.834697  ORF g.834697 m.834697 type:complete len:202 (+) comp23449_c0_seq2:645-1250(+)
MPVDVITTVTVHQSVGHVVAVGTTVVVVGRMKSDGLQVLVEVATMIAMQGTRMRQAPLVEAHTDVVVTVATTLVAEVEGATVTVARLTIALLRVVTPEVRTPTPLVVTMTADGVVAMVTVMTTGGEERHPQLLHRTMIAEVVSVVADMTIAVVADTMTAEVEVDMAVAVAVAIHHAMAPTAVEEGDVEPLLKCCATVCGWR